MSWDGRVLNEADWQTALARGSTDSPIVCKGNEFDGWTVGGVLSVGVSNPFAREYPLQSESFCGAMEREGLSWEDLKEIEQEYD